jgi:hypothetical protein
MVFFFVICVMLWHFSAIIFAKILIALFSCCFAFDAIPFVDETVFKIFAM